MMLRIPYFALALLFILVSSSKSPSPHTDLSSAVQRQNAVEEATRETLVSLSSVNGDVLLMAVKRAHKLQAMDEGPTVLSRAHDGLVMGMVGLPADRQAALRIANRHVLQHFADANEDISVELLALKMADEVYKRSSSSSASAAVPLIFNSVLLGSRRPAAVAVAGNSHHHHQEEEGGRFKVMKVDQSAGFFDCTAVALGFGASKLNSWLSKHYYDGGGGGSIVGDAKDLVRLGLRCVEELYPNPNPNIDPNPGSGSSGDDATTLECELCVASGATGIIHGPVVVPLCTLKDDTDALYSSILHGH
jgi:20S proteasome alpha/beta subunit